MSYKLILNFKTVSKCGIIQLIYYGLLYTYTERMTVNIMIENTEKNRYIFGIDIGGTACKLGLFHEDGTLLEKWQIPTDRANGGMNVFTDLAAAVDSKLEEKSINREDVIGIGAGVPASISGEGVVQKCPALGWSNFNVADKITEVIGFPAVCGNDANLAASGEAWKGANHSYSDVVFVTLGTGVGGGIICNGKILQGAHGCSGELGHIKVNPAETREDGCGGHGCLQQYASATGIANLAEEALTARGDEAKGTYLYGRIKVNAKNVFDGAKKGDEICLDVVDKFGEILGRALAGICVVFDPEVVIIGGGVSAAGDILIDAVRKHYVEWAFPPCADMEFRLASLGNDAGIYGCAKMVIDELTEL